ncbi:two component regulator with propeller domain [Neolewinella xylanilytica]|uniref:Two component regulator with propeller domain n=1 Tax=Neolewinella xylanilytica TaxID=1514080 RepID=A0A2S6I1W4_9BACT|nr:two-component regulator propeller domain-containing protein [Neolewinella xylanilytica]PPK85165.1 two component regulator with propeller domain [Neolewinella xylanilytica]
MLKQLLFFLFLPLTGILGQVDSIGQWRSLQSFSQGQYVTQSEESIIYTTGAAIFYLDKEDLSFTPLTRTDGLAGGRINIVEYHQPTETLVIIYENSTIDLLHEGRFSTLPQIDNFNFSGDKRIYDVSFSDDGNTMYLAAGYGISSLSLDEEIFNFTTFTGVQVSAATEYGDHLYAATPEGLYRVPRTGTNINDFGSWELLSTGFGLPGDYTASTVEVWRDGLYFGVDNDVYRLDGDTTTLHFRAPVAQHRLAQLSGGPNFLLAGFRCTATNCADRAVYPLTEVAADVSRLGDCAFQFNNAIEDERGRIWFGDDAEIISYLDGLGGNCNRLRYPGPPEDTNYRILHDGTSLWVAPGRLDENTSPSFDFDGVFRYVNGSWEVYRRNEIAAFRGADGQVGGDDDFATVIDVDYDPVNRIHYFSSFFEGVIARDEAGTFTLFDETNSTIELAPDAGAGRIRAAGAATDAAGFTYVAVSRAENNGIVSVRSPEGDWAALGQDCGLNIAIDIAVDANGYVWVVHRGGANGGLTVIDTNGTPLDPSDDPPCRTITMANSVLPTNQTRSIAIDQDGSIWVGTAEGVVVFNCNASPSDPDGCTGVLPQTEADGFGAYLLANEEVRTIAVDGANRKWLGTNSGAFLLSETGNEELLQFNRGNSPLLDNTVRSITIDPESGTVYFGTELGVISYLGDATQATALFNEDLIVFPNPVEPGYFGPIAIDGLAVNARVKITDLSGKLVTDGLSNGGRYIWDGNDYNGRRVTTGVYLLFASSGSSTNFEQQDSGSAVAKIVFIR